MSLKHIYRNGHTVDELFESTDESITSSALMEIVNHTCGVHRGAGFIML